MEKAENQLNQRPGDEDIQHRAKAQIAAHQKPGGRDGNVDQNAAKPHRSAAFFSVNSSIMPSRGPA